MLDNLFKIGVAACYEYKYNIMHFGHLILFILLFYFCSYLQRIPIIKIDNLLLIRMKNIPKHIKKKPKYKYHG